MSEKARRRPRLHESTYDISPYQLEQTYPQTPIQKTKALLTSPRTVAPAQYNDTTRMLKDCIGYVNLSLNNTIHVLKSIIDDILAKRNINKLIPLLNQATGMLEEAFLKNSKCLLTAISPQGETPKLM